MQLAMIRDISTEINHIRYTQTFKDDLSNFYFTLLGPYIFDVTQLSTISDPPSNCKTLSFSPYQAWMSFGRPLNGKYFLLLSESDMSICSLFITEFSRRQRRTCYIQFVMNKNVLGAIQVIRDTFLTPPPPCGIL